MQVDLARRPCQEAGTTPGCGRTQRLSLRERSKQEWREGRDLVARGAEFSGPCLANHPAEVNGIAPPPPSALTSHGWGTKPDLVGVRRVFRREGVC